MTILMIPGFLLCVHRLIIEFLIILIIYWFDLCDFFFLSPTEQTSYGEDSVSWHISRDRPSRDEVKIGTKIGYGNYFHTVELYLNNRVDQIRAAMDIHVDK